MTAKLNSEPTEYIVLASRAGHEDDWTYVYDCPARSAKDAMEGTNVYSDGMYDRFVAIPARSWKPMRVTTEQKTITKLVADDHHTHTPVALPDEMLEQVST